MLLKKPRLKFLLELAEVCMRGNDGHLDTVRHLVAWE